jgi:hypothetical protein
MANNGDSVRIGTEADRSRYANLSPLQRAELAQEMVGEILDHYDHARALISALVAELSTINEDEAKPAVQLANVLDAWINDQENITQESRLFACLHAEVAARAMETGHG